MSPSWPGREQYGALCKTWPSASGSGFLSGCRSRDSLRKAWRTTSEAAFVGRRSAAQMSLARRARITLARWASLMQKDLTMFPGLAFSDSTKGLTCQPDGSRRRLFPEFPGELRGSGAMSKAKAGSPFLPPPHHPPRGPRGESTSGPWTRGLDTRPVHASTFKGTCGRRCAIAYSGQVCVMAYKLQVTEKGGL